MKALEYLLNSQIKVGLIYGDRDYDCPWIGAEVHYDALFEPLEPLADRFVSISRLWHCKPTGPLLVRQGQRTSVTPATNTYRPTAATLAV